MKRFSEQFKKQSESISLRASERNALKERVLSYMEYHPLPKEIAEQGVTAKQEVIYTEPFRIFKFNPLYTRSFAGAFVLFLIVGIPFVAERAVPGDMLYPVKVQFNEEVRSSLSLSPYAKVAWETERMERRISEARLLASEGKLTDEAQNQVAQAVKEHTDAAQREIAEIRKSDSDEAALAEIAFASALAVQSEVLESHNEVASTQEGDSGLVVTLALAVEEARTTAEASQQGVLPSYEKLFAHIEVESTHAYELFSSVQNDASSVEVGHIERRLSDIERKIAKATALKDGITPDDVEASTTDVVLEGEVALEEIATAEEALGSSTEEVAVIVEEQESEDAEVELTEEQIAAIETQAVTILRDALMDIQKLINYMTHLDVRESVTVEDLVPVTHTDEELKEQTSALLEETVALQTKINEREVRAQKMEKVGPGKELLQTKLDEATSLLKEELYEDALVVLKEAYQIARDVDTLTKNEPHKVVEEVIAETEVGTSTEPVVE